LRAVCGAGLQPSGGVPAPWLDRPPSERAIVALYGLGIAVAQSAYWRPKFGGFSLLGKVPKLKALLSAIIVTSPVYWMLSITYFLTGYLLLMCFIVGIEPIHNWHAVLILPVVTLSNLISITIGGLGVREGLAA